MIKFCKYIFHFLLLIYDNFTPVTNQLKFPPCNEQLPGNFRRSADRLIGAAFSARKNNCKACTDARCTIEYNFGRVQFNDMFDYCQT